MATNDKTIDPRGGDIRSDSETIYALRQGVEIERRISHLEIADSRGVVHALPLLLADGGEAGATITVAHEALNEVDKRAAGPRRRTGMVQLGSLDSLIAYVDRFKRPAETVAFAPLQPAGVTVIFDYHPSGGDLAAWREDRATFACPVSRQWKLWTELAGKPLTQTQFGDLVEANADDLGPAGDRVGFVSAPDLLKVGRELTIHSVGVFERSVDVNTGQGTLLVKEEHGTKSTKIPKGFNLAIPVFEGSEDTYVLECRIRFAMEGGRPAFAFLIHNKDQVWEHALKELREKVAEDCGIPVYVGSAPTAGR